MIRPVLPGVLSIQQSFSVSLNASLGISPIIADPLIILLISSSFFSNQQLPLNYLSLQV
jgi:hypothetical protein